MSVLLTKAVFVNYECPECGKFQVIHNHSKSNKKCVFCKNPVTIVNIETCAQYDGTKWKNLDKLTNEEKLDFWKNMPSA